MKLLNIKFDDKEFAAATGNTFRGLTISRAEEGWNVVVRATDKEGVDVYAMYQEEDIEAGFNDLMDDLASKQAKYLWRLDRWGKMRDK